MSKTEDNVFPSNECKESFDSEVKNESENQEIKYDPLCYCRTCANKDSFFVPIFKGEGLNHQLNKKIEKYLPIQVTKDDDLPLQLCYNCASTIIAWDTLIIGCVEAEKKLNSLKNATGEYMCVDDVNNVENSEKADETYTPADDVDSDDEPLITKKLGTKRTSKKRRSKKEVSEEKNETERSQTENETDREKPVGLDNAPEKSFEVNPYEWRPSPEVKLPKPNASKDKRVFQCNICNKVLNRRFNFERHLLVHSGETLTCHACGKQYRGQSVLDRHIKVIHQQMRVPSMNCDYCGKGFSSRQSLEDHFRTHTGERPFICEICGKDFRARPNLIAHKKIHSGNLPFECNFCGYKCRLKGTFIDHCQRHEGKRTCLCSICGKGFVNNYDLSKHKKTHSKDRIFSCSSCNLTFVMKRYLKVHMKTHVQKSEMKAPTFKTSIF